MRIGKDGDLLGSVLWSAVPDSNPAKKVAKDAQAEADALAQERADAAEQSQENLKVALAESADDNDYELEGAQEPNESEESEESDRPNKSDSKAEWVDYAVSKGLAREEAEEFTKQDLIDEYGE
jgi:hypothetical protein